MSGKSRRVNTWVSAALHPHALVNEGRGVDGPRLRYPRFVIITRSVCVCESRTDPRVTLPRSWWNRRAGGRWPRRQLAMRGHPSPHRITTRGERRGGCACRSAVGEGRGASRIDQRPRQDALRSWGRYLPYPSPSSPLFPSSFSTTYSGPLPSPSPSAPPTPRHSALDTSVYVYIRDRSSLTYALPHPGQSNFSPLAPGGFVVLLVYATHTRTPRPRVPLCIGIMIHPRPVPHLIRGTPSWSENSWSSHVGIWYFIFISFYTVYLLSDIIPLIFNLTIGDRQFLFFVSPRRDWLDQKFVTKVAYTQAFLWLTRYYVNARLRGAGRESKNLNTNIVGITVLNWIEATWYRSKRPRDTFNII